MSDLLDLFTPTPSPTSSKRRFQEGDQVLHARAPKHKEQLLVVLGYHSNTHARCRFVSARYAGNKDARKNPTAMVAIQIIGVRHLLDPRQFGIKVPSPPSSARHVDGFASGKTLSENAHSSQVFTDKLIFDAHNCARKAGACPR